MKILKLNAISPVADAIFKGHEYSDSVQDPDGIMLRSASMHDYAFGDRLLAIARAGAGVNNIPLDRCAEKGIVVFNTPGANANAVKELVLCELFLGGRKITAAANWVQSLKDRKTLRKRWKKARTTLSGRKLQAKRWA